MTPSPKKWPYPQFFFLILSKNVAFSKKLLNEKYSKPNSPIKKVIFIFARKTPHSLKKRIGPQKRFFDVFSENTAFLKKLLNNKIFSTLFVIKSYVNFGSKTPPFPKELSMCPQNSFSQLSRKILLFSKKLSNKKIFFI